jgi:hypothetical protein
MDLVTVIISVAVPLVGLAAYFLGRKYTGKAEALEAIYLAVTEVANVYVDQRKKLSADGTLTEAEKKMALDMAINRALEIAKGPALQFIKNQSPAWLKTVIEYFVAARRGLA